MVLFLIFLVKDWMSLVPPTALLAGTVYTLYMAYCPEARPKVCKRQNTTIRLGEAKVVDMIDVEGNYKYFLIKVYNLLISYISRYW